MVSRLLPSAPALRQSQVTLPSRSSTSHPALVETPLDATDVDRLAALTPAWPAGAACTALTPAWPAGAACTALTPAWPAGAACTALTPAWPAGAACTALTPAWPAGAACTALTPAWPAGAACTALTPAWPAGAACTALTPAWPAGAACTALTPAWPANTGEAETNPNTHKVTACVCAIFISLPLCSIVPSQIPTHPRHLQRSGNNRHRS